MSHIDNLEKVSGSLRSKAILDIGSGQGNFLIECAQKGYSCVGLELNQRKIESALINAKKSGVEINIVSGRAESLPFKNSSFDFANLSEVIEHVQDPPKVLSELYRVLKPEGRAYVSVHNRFGFYDTHFHVYFLGWLPRIFADSYLSIVGRHKNYSNFVDLQNINDMHYFTFGGFSKIAKKSGLTTTDIREIRLRRKFKGLTRLVSLFIYRTCLRRFYFSTFHFLLTRS